MMVIKTRCLLAILLLFLSFQGMTQINFKGKKENLGPAINDAFDQVLPVFSPDGDTLFFSEKGATANNYKILYSVRSPEGWTVKKEKQQLDLQTQGDKFLYTALCGDRYLLNGHYKQIAKNTFQTKGLCFNIPSSVRNGANFQSLIYTGIDTMVNSRFTSAWLFEPARVLFLSIIKGGNEDLYVSYPRNPEVSEWSMIEWSSPQRLSINSPYIETTPFLSPDGRTLYFSSDRPGGYGLLDVYSCTRTGSGWTDWTAPKNVGAPVNSKGSDLYFTLQPGTNDAYFVSTDSTFGERDIFRVSIDTSEVPPKKKTTIDSVTKSNGKDTGLVGKHYKPNNIVFLLDLSNSMKTGQRMALLQSSMRQLLQYLRPIDKVTLYSFGDATIKLYETQSVTDIKKLNRIMDSVRSRTMSTNGSAAIIEGYEEAKRKLLKDGNNQIFLITDGDFPIWPNVERMIFETPQVKLCVVMIDESDEGRALLAKFTKFPDVQILSLMDVKRDAAALLNNVRENARKSD